MARISAQIDQLKKRLRDETDPMLEEVLTSLQQLQRLETVEGLIEFHEQQYCGRAEACEITGKPSETIRQYIDNYIHHPDSRRRTKIAAIPIGSSQRKSYVIVKKSLRDI